jgi:hypothetical protein
MEVDSRRRRFILVHTEKRLTLSEREERRSFLGVTSRRPARSVHVAGSAAVVAGKTRPGKIGLSDIGHMSGVY